MKKKNIYLSVLLMLVFVDNTIILNGQDNYKQLMARKERLKYGFIDKEGKLRIPPKYIRAQDFSSGLAVVSSTIGRYFYINKNGDIAIDNNFTMDVNFSEAYAVIRGESRHGYINSNGVVIIKPQFSYVSDFSEGLASIINADGEWNVIDKNGEIVLKSLPYRGVSCFVGGLAAVLVSLEWVYDKKKDPTMEVKIHKFGFINKKGEMVIPAKFDQVYNFSEGMACVNVGGWISTNNIEQFIGGKYGFINKDGKVVIKPRYSRAGSFSEGLAVVFLDKKGWSYIDKRGKQVIKPTYENAESFSEGLAAVQIKGKYGYIDKKGKMIIEPTFDLTRMFSEGLAAVKVGEKWGYINKTGRYIIEPKFSEAYSFSEGLARVQIYVEEVNVDSKQ